MSPPADPSDPGTMATTGQARRALPHRRCIDGVAFDPLTEAQTVRVVMDSLDDDVGGIIVTPNVDILRLLRRPEHQELARRADLVVADGMPVVWASRLARMPLPERVAGSSLARTLAAQAAERGHALYLLGGPAGAAEAAAANLVTRHPTLQVAGTACPPRGFEDDRLQWARVVAHLEQTRPDIVYLALGAPKQERIALRLAARFPQTWFLGCGASVTFVAGFIPQAPRWMQRSGLEWIHRLAREPGRLWRRYLVDDVPYALALFARAIRARRRGHW